MAETFNVSIEDLLLGEIGATEFNVIHNSITFLESKKVPEVLLTSGAIKSFRLKHYKFEDTVKYKYQIVFELKKADGIHYLSKEWGAGKDTLKAIFEKPELVLTLQNIPIERVKELTIKSFVKNDTGVVFERADLVF